MKNKKNHKFIEPIPDKFPTAEEAGIFWDTHSAADYEKYLEPTNLSVDIKRRHFEIEIDQESFFALNIYAKKIHNSVKNIASNILKEKLVYN